MKRIVIEFVAIFVLFYLLGAFIVLEPDINQWSLEGRCALVLLTTWVCFLASLIRNLKP